MKYTLKGFGYLLGFFLLLYIVLYIYVSANKQKIIKQVTTEIGKRMEGEVTIKDVDLSIFKNFPRISVVLKQVSIKDTMYAMHKYTFFQAEEVSVSVGFWKLIKKQSSLTGIKVERGSVYLYTDTSGYSNKYLLNIKKDSSKASTDSGNNQLKHIDLINVRVTIDDREREKLHDFMVNKINADIEDEKSFLKVKLENDILVHSLAFNLDRGSFIKEKTFEGEFELRFEKNLKQLQFDSIDVEIGGHPLNLTGRFDLAKIGDSKPQLSLQIHTRDLNYEFAKTLLTPKIATALSLVSVSNKVDVSTSIVGPIRGGEPLIKVWWQTKHSDVKSPLIEFEDCSFTGSYINEVVPGQPRTDPNSKIELHDFSGKWQGLPITSDNIIINNLLLPQLVCDLKSNFPLTTLNDFLKSGSISMNAGEAMIDISYNGPLQKNTTNNSFVNGVINIKNGLINYNPRDIAMKNVNGKIVFRNSDVFVQNLQTVVLGNSIVMEGVAKNALTLVNTQPNKVMLDWSIYSPSLNLASFTGLLKQRKKVVTKKSGNKLESAAQKIDAVLEQGSINVSLRADKLSFKKFEATNATALVSILQDSWLLQKVRLEHAGGEMTIAGSLQDKGPSYHQAKVNVQLNDVDVSKVLASFNNFGQDGITSQSLHGKLTSEVNASMALDDAGIVYPSSMEGTVDFSLKDGALIDYEPVKKLQNFLFKNRDFENIQFAELKNTLEIKNQEVKINRMEIQSSVLSMFVEGKFSMKGTTDVSIQIPLSNLRKRKKDYVPENVGADKKGGTSIYIRGTPGADGNVKFKYDLFHKFRGKDSK